VAHDPTSPPLSELEAAIGYNFVDPELLAGAMLHRSYIAEHPGPVSNERLEFLGDAVLGLVIADLSYRQFPDAPEGQLSETRKRVVNAGSLAEVAREIGLGAHLRLGRGEDAAGGRDKQSILSDACEAVIGAVYLDGGLDAAYQVVHAMIADRLQIAIDAPLDHKTALQEICSRLKRAAPVYVLTSVGPDHDKEFTATVSIGGERLGKGTGKSKKEAEQAAAAVALRALSDLEHDLTDA
jgi:ribonuclease III